MNDRTLGDWLEVNEFPFSGFLNLILEVHFLRRNLTLSSEIQYEMLDIQSGHPPFHFTKGLPQHVLLRCSKCSSWGHSYTFMPRAHHSSLNAYRSLPGAHQTTPGWATHCLYTRPLHGPCFCSSSLLQMSSVLLCWLCTCEHWQNHHLSWYFNYGCFYFPLWIPVLHLQLVNYLHLPCPIQNIAALQPSYSLLCVSSRQDWGLSCWTSSSTLCNLDGSSSGEGLPPWDGFSPHLSLISRNLFEELLTSKVMSSCSWTQSYVAILHISLNASSYGSKVFPLPSSFFSFFPDYMWLWKGKRRFHGIERSNSSHENLATHTQDLKGLRSLQKSALHGLFLLPVHWPTFSLKVLST